VDGQDTGHLQKDLACINRLMGKNSLATPRGAIKEHTHYKKSGSLA